MSIGDQLRASVRVLLCSCVFPVLAFLAACGTTRPTSESAEVASTVAPLVAAAERAGARGDYDAAVASYREAYARTPWNTRLKRALAAAYAERAARSRDRAGLTGLRTAERDLREGLALFPDDPALQRSLGVVLVELAAHEADPSRAGALREEARGLAPDVVEESPMEPPGLERRVDLAFELIERGQIVAAIDDLERIHADHPEHAGAALLLARARVRRGTELAGRGDYPGAGACFDRAVELYERLEQCRAGECEPAEPRLAHWNRVTTWLTGGHLDEARRALEEAERAGFRFPELRAELAVD